MAKNVSGSRPWYRRWWVWVVAGLLVVGYLGSDEREPDATDGPLAADVSPATSNESETPADATTAEDARQVLRVTDQKDGDSWVASDGEEYRLGLINTPERDEVCGSEATAFTRDFLADGFTVDAYASDTYGRQVAEVFDVDGESLNVALAESGLADDRFLEEFRDENPDLADRIEKALASAPVPDCQDAAQPRGFAAQAPTKAAAPTPKAERNDCRSGYSPCLPIVTDLDCPDVVGPVEVSGDDPYRLDRDGDGIGCDT